MLGAILGDIVGSRWEFGDHKSKEFDFLTKDCQFTDDSVLTIATADAIMNNKSFADAYHEWGNKYPNVSYGSNFHSWLHGTTKLPYNSFGNGSAMRVSPVAWLHDDLQTVLEKAEESAICTHNHIEGIKGACATAMAIYLARYNTDKKIIKEAIELYFEYDLSKTLDDIRPNYSFDVTCQGSVPESIICFLESESYEDCIRNAVSLGGDSDTQACIAGGIAEAYYGLPPSINREQITSYLTDDIREVYTQFLIRLLSKKQTESTAQKNK